MTLRIALLLALLAAPTGRALWVDGFVAAYHPAGARALSAQRCEAVR